MLLRKSCLKSLIVLGMLAVYMFAASASVHARTMNLTSELVSIADTSPTVQGNCHTDETATKSSSPDVHHTAVKSPSVPEHDCYESCMGTYDELSSMKVIPKITLRTVSPTISLQSILLEHALLDVCITTIVDGNDPPFPVFETATFNFHKITQKHE